MRERIFKRLYDMGYSTDRFTHKHPNVIEQAILLILEELDELEDRTSKSITGQEVEPLKLLCNGEPSILVAYIRDSLDSGPILEASSDFLKELHEGGGGWDIGDYNMPMPQHPGIQVLEGWLEYTGGEEPDVHFTGNWRQLTHWEMSRFRHAMPACDDNCKRS